MKSAAAVLCALALTACQAITASGDGDSDLSLVITQVPVGTTNPGAWLPPDGRYPAGSRVVLARPGGSPTAVHVLSRGLWAAGAPAVSFDGGHVVFAGKPAAGGHWSIYEAALHGSRPRKVADLGRDCSDPAYLPDHRVVFSCADDQARASWSLYVHGDGEGTHRITFAPGRAVTPTVLADGRILFSLSMSRPEERAPGFALFTINPDGTLLDAFTDGHAPGPAELRPRLTPDRTVLFVSVVRGSELRRAERTELAYPRARRSLVNLPASSPEELQPGGIEAYPQGGVLLTAPGAKSWGVFALRSGDLEARSLFDGAEWDEIEAVPVVVIAPPRRRPTALNPERTTGQVVCYDAAHTQRAVQPAGEPRRPARLEVQAHGTRGPVAVMDAPIQNDGSFVLELPADRALRIRTLDAGGRLMNTSGWFWLRPGEVRACFGCHEDRGSAPINRRVQALAEPAAPATASQAGR